MRWIWGECVPVPFHRGRRSINWGTLPSRSPFRRIKRSTRHSLWPHKHRTRIPQNVTTNSPNESRLGNRFKQPRRSHKSERPSSIIPSITISCISVSISYISIIPKVHIMKAYPNAMPSYLIHLTTFFLSF